MESIAKVVYPTPPPTTNNLTTKQRSLLLRKAKKIEQILGYPPHLTDTLCYPNGSNNRPSVESSESTSSTLVYPDSGYKNAVSWFCYPNGNRSLAPSAGHGNGSSQIPLLRVASKSLRLELTAVTNWPAKPSVTIEHEPCAPSSPDSELQLKTSPTDPVIVVPTFSIPTSHTHRKAKMDRIRRRLGSEVPYEVVFPEDVEKESSDPFEEPRLQRKHAELGRPLPTLPHSAPAPLCTLTHKQLEHRHPPLISNIANERLSLIPECPDESSGEFAVDFSGLRDKSIKRHDTAESICSQNSDGQGVGSLTRRPTSYRKPPPPMLDASLCSF